LLKAEGAQNKRQADDALARQPYFGDRFFRAGFRLPFEAVAGAVFLARGVFFFASTGPSSASISREA
jgi:hypothetical protein